jgi:hypothetical protein
MAAASLKKYLTKIVDNAEIRSPRATQNMRYFLNKMIEDLDRHVRVGHGRFILNYRFQGVRRGVTLTRVSLDRFIRKLSADVNLQPYVHTGSDAIEDFDIRDNRFEFKGVRAVGIRGRGNNDGNYFNYYNLTEIDLHRYQIFTEEEIMLTEKSYNQLYDIYLKTNPKPLLTHDKYITKLELKINCEEIKRIRNNHCLYITFLNSNILTIDELKKLKKMILGGAFPKSGLKDISEMFKVGITLTELISESFKSQIIKTKDNRFEREINIALYKNHYFLNEKINVHLFLIDNRDNPLLKVNARKNEATCFSNATKRNFKYSTEYKQNSFAIVRRIFDTQGFKEIEFEAQYLTEDYQMYVDDDSTHLIADDIVVRKKIKAKISPEERYREGLMEHKSDEMCDFHGIREQNYNVVYADTETLEVIDKSTDPFTYLPEAFIVSFKFNCQKISSVYGIECVKVFLNNLNKENTKLYTDLLKDLKENYNLEGVKRKLVDIIKTDKKMTEEDAIIEYEASIKTLSRFKKLVAPIFDSEIQQVRIKLNKLPIKTIVYFHNLKFDWQQIFKFVQVTSSVEKDGQMYSFTCNFFGLIIEFRDSYKMIPEALREFSKMFGLKEVKDVMPYGLYTPENSFKFVDGVYVKDALKHLKAEDHKQFLDNLIALKLTSKGLYYYNDTEKKYDLYQATTKFDHIAYAVYYCEKDVEVMSKGFDIFKDTMKKDMGMDVFNYLTISSLAHDYFIRAECYMCVEYIGGTIRDFVQRAVVGGRVCSMENKKYIIDKNIQDFDACSLYPSAMNRISGFPTGSCKIWDNTVNLEEVKYYVVEIKVIKGNKKEYGIPMMCYPEKGERVWTNCLDGKQVVVDKITLEDYIKYYEIEYEIVKGVYWNLDLNKNINEKIANIVNMRSKLKKEGNIKHKVYKLIANSAYGKTIQKATTTQTTYHSNVGEGENKPSEVFIMKNYNVIELTEVINERTTKVVVNKSKYLDINIGHCGTLILSMSKRIMNEVNNVAHINEIAVFYVDTDSMHILEVDVDRLKEAFKGEFDRELVGSDIGQFHSDFSHEDMKDGTIYSRKCIILGKKCYLDILVGDSKPKGDEKVEKIERYHIRMKGINTNSIIAYAAKNNLTVEEIYVKLFNNEEIKFDLCTGGVKFEYIKGGGIKRKEKFERKVSFKD